MTTNQIAFARQKEEGRHNLETESQGRQIITETNRHNLATEVIGWGNVGAVYAQVEEQKRHNIASERINWYDVDSQRKLRKSQASMYEEQAAAARKNAETNRRQSNIAEFQAKIASAKYDEEKRHNLELERVNRFNINENVGIGWFNAETRRADTTSLNWFREQQIAETKAHNIATEEIAEKQAQASMTQSVSSVIGTIFGRTGIVGGIGSLLGGH